VHTVSTPPFIAIPDGVTEVAVPDAPLPLLSALAVDSVTGQPVPPRGDVLLVPGFTGSKEDFIALLRPLAERGWRVAGIDLPGQGGAPALGGRGAYTEETLAEAVLGVIDWFAPDRPVHVVGHSMGGLATRRLVLDHIDRLASWIAMSSGPSAVPDHAHGSLVNLQTSLDVASLEVIWQFKEAGDRANGWQPNSPEVADFCRRRFVTNDPASLYDYATLLRTAPDLTEQLAAAAQAVGLPLGVVTGEVDDAWTPDIQRDMARRLGATWIELPGLGHNPGVEDPELTADALNRLLGAAAILHPSPANR
jgi:pimeloyl-ACP methyl ester carboxylesterase